MRVVSAVVTAVAMAFALSGCVVVRTAAHVTGTVVSTTVDVTGAVVGGTARAVTGGNRNSDEKKKEKSDD
jgi:phosphate/sulfate permease